MLVQNLGAIHSAVSRGALSYAIQMPKSGLTRTGEVDRLLDTAQRVANCADPLFDDDFQLSLSILNSPRRTPPHAPLECETLERIRFLLTDRFEAALRDAVETPPAPSSEPGSVAAAIATLPPPEESGSLSKYIEHSAHRIQIVEYLTHAAAWLLSHPHALPENYVSRLRRSIRAAGLATGPGSYIHHVPAVTLIGANAIDMLARHPHLRSALAGYTAAVMVESTRTAPWIAAGMARVGMRPAAADHHTALANPSAAAIQIDARDAADAATREPGGSIGEVLFGAALANTLAGWTADHLLDNFQRDESSLHAPLITSGHFARV